MTEQEKIDICRAVIFGKEWQFLRGEKWEDGYGFEKLLASISFGWQIRLKPEPDVVCCYVAVEKHLHRVDESGVYDLRITYDQETEKIRSVEVFNQ